MNDLTVVIPSRNKTNLLACIKAIREAGETLPHVWICVVDDGDLMRNLPPGVDHCITGVKPFVYARNCNIGMSGVNKINDILLCNDDALLVDRGGFTRLQRAAEDHPEYGIIGATTNQTGNPNQWARPRVGEVPGLREDPRMVCFVAVLIPRRTIDLVGLLDERFVGYAYEDDDYCVRVRQAGLKIGIHDGCYVDHGSLQPTFRPSPTSGVDMSQNREIFLAKWGRLDV